MLEVEICQKVLVMCWLFRWCYVAGIFLIPRDLYLY